MLLHIGWVVANLDFAEEVSLEDQAFEAEGHVAFFWVDKHLRQRVRWPVNSNARTGEKAKEISKSRIPNFPNFLGLVLGCIEAKFCK